MKNNIFEEFKNKIKGRVLKDELLKKHTYFKIGGPADFYIEPVDEEDLKKAINISIKNNYDFYIIGNGTNLLVSDKGYRGVIIKIGKKFNKLIIEDGFITAGSGVLLSTIANKACENELTGLEFASGIPGYLGGAIIMNAGAYGGEMKDVVVKVKCMDNTGNIHIFDNSQMNFRYRNSEASEKNLIVLEAQMKLNSENKEKIVNKIKELTAKRTEKQPLNMPSAGSTFKRPPGGYAAKLIEDAGLKGLKLGDAMVSEKHSGFVVNCGNATCDDVLELMKVVIKTVRDKYDIILEPEVKMIGINI